MPKWTGRLALAGTLLLGSVALIVPESNKTVYADTKIQIEGIEPGGIEIRIPEAKKETKVYRSDKEDGKYKHVGTIVKGHTTFTDLGGDTELGDKIWYYKIGSSIVSQKAGATNNLYETDTDAIRYIKEQLESQAPSITLYYGGYTEGLDARLIKECIDNKAHDVTVKTESNNLGKRNKQKIYMIQYIINYDLTPDQKKEVESRVQEITQDMDGMTDAEKVEKIYTKIAESTLASKDKSTAYDALIKQKADSEGVAKAMHMLFTEIGMEDAIVNNESGYFNVVRMADGAWYDVDVYREMASINKYEYNRYDYLLTPRLEEHAIKGYANSAKERWNFSKVQPENLTAMTGSNGLEIHWDRVPHADGYRVQRSDTKDGAYTDVLSYTDQPKEERGKTTQNYIKDSTAKAGKVYYYRVKAYSTTKDGLDEGSYSEAMRVTYYGDLKLSINTSSIQPLLSWDSLEGAGGYRIYRKEAGESEEKLIDEIKGTGYVDQTAQFNHNYAYRIQVIRNSTVGDMYEYYSNYATTYGIRKITNEENGLKIEWQAKNECDGYRLYRYDPKTKEDALLATLKVGQSEYIDKTAKPENKYTYRIAPFRDTKSGRDISIKSISKTGVMLNVPMIAGGRTGDIPIIMWTGVKGASGYEIFVDGKIYKGATSLSA